MKATDVTYWRTLATKMGRKLERQGNIICDLERDMESVVDYKAKNKVLRAENAKLKQKNSKLKKDLEESIAENRRWLLSSLEAVRGAGNVNAIQAALEDICESVRDLRRALPRSR